LIAAVGRDESAMAQPGKAPTFWQVVASVLASFFGVQSSKNRERDFKHGRAAHFVAIGLLATAAFVVLLVLGVRLVLRLSAQ
jgi:hypothetical protein